jgi:hypothetical protein
MIEFPKSAANLLLGPRPVSSWDESLVGTYPEEFLSPMFTHSLNYWPIFSQSLRDVLKPLVSDSIEFLPFHLQQSDGSNVLADEYSIGHVLRKIECIDRGQTKVRNDDWTPRLNGTYRVVPPLCLQRALIEEVPLFSILESPVNLIVREDVKRAFESVNATEACFEEMLVSSDAD